MSYDFHLFRLKPGVDPLELAQASYADETDEPNPGPPVPEKEQQKRQNAILLQLANSALTIYPLSIARSRAVWDARKPRHRSATGTSS
jgi:hypothetical protein